MGSNDIFDTWVDYTEPYLIELSYFRIPLACSKTEACEMCSSSTMVVTRGLNH